MRFIALHIPLILGVKVLHLIGMSALPDIYNQSPRAAGPRAESGHIRQSTSDCVTTIM